MGYVIGVDAHPGWRFLSGAQFDGCALGYAHFEAFLHLLACRGAVFRGLLGQAEKSTEERERPFGGWA
jgi:hypothetical protein